MSLLVTGASGFLGRHLLEAHPGPALALVRDPAAWAALDWAAPLRAVRPIRGDLRDLDALAGSGALARVRTIVHLAGVVHHGRHGHADVDTVNVDGALAAVRAGARIGARVVLASSSGVVGCAPDPASAPDEDAPYARAIVGTWPYYASKIRMEEACRAEAEARGVALVVVRPPSLQGPGDHRFRSTTHVARQLLGRMPYVPAGGIHVLDVRDAARSLLRVADHPAPRPVYHLPGHALPLADFFATVARLSGVPGPRRHLPHRAVWLAAVVADALARRLGRARSWLPDPVIVEMAHRHWGLASRHAAADLGHAPRPLDETLGDTIAWLRAHHPELRASGG